MTGKTAPTDRDPRLLRVLAIAFCCAGGAGPAFGQVEYVPPALLAEHAGTDLEIAPRELALLGDRLLVVGTDGEARDVLVLLDATSLEPQAQRSLGPLQVERLLVADEGMVALVGREGEDSVVELLDADLESRSRRTFPFAAQAAAIGEQGTLVLVESTRDEALAHSVSLADLGGEATAVAIPAPGVLGVWLSERERVVFLNGDAGSLLAADWEYGKPFDGLVNRYSRGEPAPFSVVGLMADRACRGNAGTSFLVADTDNGTLALIDYDAAFRTLDVKARTPAAPRLDSDEAAGGYQQGGRLAPASPALLASACDQSVLWLGDLRSGEVLQFSRNTELDVLERVGKLELGFRPSALLISPDGAFGIAAAAAERRLVRFAPSEAGLNGDPDVRRLQRWLASEGFEIGPVDGFVGPNTTRAVTVLERELGVEVNIETDPQGTLRTLQDMRE